ncbi:MAG: Qat anti-phage system ATPase QatA [Algoriphagus aquaeductus]|uniref:Qat anti-phage system ATPase QatA n=1 Tax=Algoriphagus aquaeductus TaxID=475299 RepID=UPI00391B5BF5
MAILLSDNETKVDLLNSEAFATTIVKLIREKPDSPVTIGVHGDWGAGKSSVLEMIEANFVEEKRVVCIKFNGWRFQGFEDAKIALLENIVTELVEKRSLLTKASEQVKDIFKRIDWLKVAKKAGGLAFTAFTGIPSGDLINTITSGLSKIAQDPAKLATKENLAEIASQAGSLLKEKGDSKNIPKEISEFREEFDKLLMLADVDQLVVLVDDLDRCLPETAIETLEAIRLFIFTNKTAFVVAADENMIEYAVRRHFPDLPEGSSYQAYTRNYLEKLIQVPFRIPILGEFETRIYVTLLLVGSAVGDDLEGFNKLIQVARDLLKKPWEKKALDASAVNKALGTDAGISGTALLISDQIAPILARGTKGNPRQIKRFLNTLMLRQLMAEARGFGSDINLPALAKLMIAERFMPNLFDQLAAATATSANGSCPELKYIEDIDDFVGEPTTDANKKTRKKTKEAENDEESAQAMPESSMLNGWMSSADILQWAKLKPKLSSLDLRPYLFIAKDRKDYFITSGGLGHLTTTIEKLFGAKLMVTSMSADLKLLTNEEALIVFEAVKSRILSNGDFSKQPAGVEGLTVLVKSHPELQSNVLDFLDALPLANVGTWVTTGWETSLVDQVHKQRFTELLEKWSKTDANKFVSTAAKAVLRIKK